MAAPTTTSDTAVAVMMTPWLHFTGGDFLYFSSWTPSSKGAIAGACIGLFILAVFERFVFAMRGVMEGQWRRRARSLLTRRFAVMEESSECCDEPSVSDTKPKVPSANLKKNIRTIAPFIPANDLARGAIHAVQALLMYALMLAVMTFQAAYIISIILGLGIGEIAFGRFSTVEGSHVH